MADYLPLVKPTVLVAILAAGIFGGFVGAYGFEAVLWVRGFALRLPAHLRRLCGWVAPLRFKIIDSVNALVGLGGFGFFIVVFGMTVVEFELPDWMGSIVGLLGAIWIGVVAFMCSGVACFLPSPIVPAEISNDSEMNIIVIKRITKTYVVCESQEAVCC